MIRRWIATFPYRCAEHNQPSMRIPVSTWLRLRSGAQSKHPASAHDVGDRASLVAFSTCSMVFTTRPSRAIRSTQRTNVMMTMVNTRRVSTKIANRPADPNISFWTAIRETILKIKAPINADNAFWVTSSAMTNGMERGVEPVLAEA